MKVTDGIEWIIACTDQFDRSVEFFRDTLGLEVRREGIPITDQQFSRFAQIEMPNGVVLEIVEPRAAFREIYTAPVVSITVDDVPKARKELEGRHVEFLSPIFHAGGGWGWAYFRAPDGNVYQIQGPSGPDPQPGSA
jgi:catechol 2,3-dioxygenase-like lactoylglutathione lyase family enzyme